jgi:DNA-binding CsgD family transcriptional regulator
VQKQTAQILAYKAEGLSASGIARVLDVSEAAVARILRIAGLSPRCRTPHMSRQNAEREKILVLRSQGKNGEEIARKLEIPVNRVYSAINRASGLDPRFSLGKSHLTQDELDQIVALRAQHQPPPEIARMLGRSERSVYRAVARLIAIDAVNDDSNRRVRESAGGVAPAATEAPHHRTYASPAEISRPSSAARRSDP